MPNPNSHSEPRAVPRVRGLRNDDLWEQYVSRGQPVIVTDALGAWPTTAQLRLDELHRRHRSTDIWVRGGTRDTYFEMGWLKLGAYVDFLSSGESEDPVLRRWKDALPYASFSDRIPIPAQERLVQGLVPRGFRASPMRLFMGPSGALTPLHCDTTGVTFLAQIEGRKKLTLFPAEDAPLLYPSKIFEGPSIYSTVNLDEPDPRRHPRFALATRYEVIVEPGELLVFPNRFWHEVRCVDVAVTLTCRIAKHRPIELWRVKNNLLYACHFAGLYRRGMCHCHFHVHGKDHAYLMGWRSTRLDERAKPS